MPKSRAHRTTWLFPFNKLGSGKLTWINVLERRVSFCALTVLAWVAYLNAFECAQQRAKLLL